jgi:hypothetical protein
MNHAGGCHCGNIHVLLRLSKPPERTPVRTCTCSFCRSHNPRTSSRATTSGRQIRPR